jgi:hypothetical protein
MKSEYKELFCITISFNLAYQVGHAVKTRSMRAHPHQEMLFLERL